MVVPRDGVAIFTLKPSACVGIHSFIVYIILTLNSK